MVENWKSNIASYGVDVWSDGSGNGLEWIFWYRGTYNYQGRSGCGYFSSCLFIWALWGFGCLSASFTMEKMANENEPRFHVNDSRQLLFLEKFFLQMVFIYSCVSGCFS